MQRSQLHSLCQGPGQRESLCRLVFKNKTEGLDFSCPKMIKNVFPAGVTEYNCTVKAADVLPGNYSFVVDVAARGSPSGKKTAFINVLATNNASWTDQGHQTQADIPTKQMAQKAPAVGKLCQFSPCWLPCEG